MKRVFRKQTRDDFARRIERLDPKYAKLKPEERIDRKPWEVEKHRLKSDKPLKMSVLGFGLALVAILGANDPDMVRALFLRSGWPGNLLTYAMNGAAILVVGLAIFFLGNLLRIVNPRATGRGNAAGLVVGALGAVGVFSIPDAYIQTGFDMAGFRDANHVLSFAQEKSLILASIDWASVVPVSSTAK